MPSSSSSWTFSVALAEWPEITLSLHVCLAEASGMVMAQIFWNLLVHQIFSRTQNASFQKCWSLKHITQSHYSLKKVCVLVENEPFFFHVKSSHFHVQILFIYLFIQIITWWWKKLKVSMLFFIFCQKCSFSLNVRKCNKDTQKVKSTVGLVARRNRAFGFPLAFGHGSFSKFKMSSNGRNKWRS